LNHQVGTRVAQHDNVRSLPWIVVLATCAIVGISTGSALTTAMRAPIPRIDPLPPFSLNPTTPILDEVRIERLAPPPPDQPPALVTSSSTHPCSQGWRLVGAAVVREHPERSAIAVRSPEGAAVLGEGEEHADRTVVSISTEQVLLSDARGEVCALTYGEPETLVDTTNGPRVVPPIAHSDPAPVVDPGAIDPGLFERALTPQGMAELLGPVRLLPTDHGLRVFGVRRGSGAEQLGFQNGDVIVEADGAPITPDSALTLLARLRAGDSVSLVLERRGERVEKSFRLAI
jgi:hypothetical protein